MSMTDNIFDVQAALRDKPEASLFGEIITYLNEIEEQRETLIKQIRILKGAIKIVGHPLEACDRVNQPVPEHHLPPGEPELGDVG